MDQNNIRQIRTISEGSEQHQPDQNNIRGIRATSEKSETQQGRAVAEELSHKERKKI